MSSAGREGAGPVASFAIRLAAIAGIFGLAVVVELRGGGAYSETELTALYALVLAGFLSALSYGVLAWYGGRASTRSLMELVGDGLLITGFVYCSGGVRSVFGFLYTIWIVHAAVRAGTRGAIYGSGVATLAFGAMAWGAVEGFLPAFHAEGRPQPGEAFTAFVVHGSAFVSVALLAHRLARTITLGERELRELGEIHGRIVDNVESGLLTVDEGGRITSFNREAERITGCSARQVLGREITVCLPELAAAAIHDGPSTRIEGSFENLRGDSLHLGMSRSPLRDATGRSEGAILIFQDLTHVAAMEEQLRRSERLSVVGQLAAGLAHEIRNPLGSLSGAIELLGADLPAADVASRRLLRIVERETSRLNRLVSDFLAYAGPGPGRREPVALAELFEEIRVLLAGGPNADLALSVEIEVDCRATGDPDRLRQVFWNLVLNAAEASAGGSKLRVHAATVEHEGRRTVEVAIADEGCGIPHDRIERVCEPFYTAKAGGTGLGLATVHRVVEAHGGDLRIESELGKGTTVRVRLPV